MAIEFHNLRVSDVRRETPDAVSIAFDVPEGLRGKYNFHPGQHLTLRRVCDGQELRRSYSICAGMDDGEIRVAVKRVAGGVFSSLCNESIQPGDSIDVMTPQGRFGLAPDPAQARNYLAVVAGSGITPILSLLRTLLTREPHSRFALIYGNRTSADILFKEALEDLKDRFLDRLVVHHVLSREMQEIALFNGRIDGGKVAALIPSFQPAADIDHAFLCGPGGMIADVRETLIGLGMPAERVHVEFFSADGVPVTPRNAPEPRTETAPSVATARATLDGSVHEIPMRAGEDIITAGERLGLDMPFSCRGGMCCTCRAKLVEGKVRMEVNYSLEPWEIEAGFILTCQSHPLTPQIVVDYDAV